MKDSDENTITKEKTYDKPLFDSEHERILQELDNLAWVLDESVRLPGGFRIGADAIIGLVPGIGDALGLGVSLILISKARQAGATRGLQTRMLANVVVETAVGAIPLIGDGFDFWFKANRRNMNLLRDHLERNL